VTSPLRIRVATAADREALRRLNERLRAGGVRYQLPLEGGVPGEFRDSADGHPVYRDLLVVGEGDEIRAGLLLYHGAVWEGGVERPFAWVQLPVSEGLVDPRHSMAIVMLMKTVIGREPLLMSLGIGSMRESYAQLLVRLGWRHAAVPFVFHPVRPGELLRRLPAARRRGWARLAARASGLTGLDRALSGIAGLVRGRGRRAALGGARLEPAPRFDDWADVAYRSARGDYGAAVARDAATLNVRYPADDPRYVRLRVRRRVTGEELGWIIVIHGQLPHSQYFGDLHVGTLVDGFARADDVRRVVQAGADYLADAGADLIVANWSHRAWLEASRSCGFLGGPSNYFLFVSPRGNSILEASCPLEAVHMTRGDNDGPGHLLPSR
jgi:hypothetical protein